MSEINLLLVAICGIALFFAAVMGYRAGLST